MCITHTSRENRRHEEEERFHTAPSPACRHQDSAPRNRACHIATPLESYDLILGVGWLAEHDVLVGWRNRSLEVRTPGHASRHIRPMKVIGGTQADQLASISVKGLRKEVRRGNIVEAYAVLLREAEPTPSGGAGQGAGQTVSSSAANGQGAGQFMSAPPPGPGRCPAPSPMSRSTIQL